MCFGGQQPQAPQIVYQGPSQAEIDANRAALESYSNQISAQQKSFQEDLQRQIDAANADTQRMRQQFDADLKNTASAANAQVGQAKSDAAAQVASAAAAGGLEQVGAYAIGATQSDALENQKTTAAVTKKEKPKSTLKISTSALPSTAGTGLNIGV